MKISCVQSQRRYQYEVSVPDSLDLAVCLSQSSLMVEEGFALVEQAARTGSDLIVTIEGFNESVSPRDPRFDLKEYAEPLDGPIAMRFSALAARYATHIVAGLYTVREGKCYNSAVLYGPGGEIIGIYDKVHQPYNDGKFFESGNSYPVFETEKGKIGMLICWDMTYPEACRELVLGGADLIVCPTMGWEPMYGYARAYENCINLAVAMYVPYGRDLWEGCDPSCIVDSRGRIVAAASRTGSDIVTAELDILAVPEPMYGADTYTGLHSMREIRLSQRRPETYGRLCRTDLPWTNLTGDGGTICASQSRPLYLHEYRPKTEIVVEEHLLDAPKFPAIDVHTHIGAIYSDYLASEFGGKRADLDETVAMFKRHGIKRIVNLDGFWDGFDGLTVEQILKSLEKHKDFIITFVSVDTEKAKQKGFEAYVRKHLTESREKGARGIKLFKSVSLMVYNEQGKLVPGRNIAIDDPRLKVIWQMAEELDMPVLAHIGDPKAFFQPVDGSNEQYEELLVHPDWSYAAPGLYTFDEMMMMQENLLRDNPGTTFIIPHFGSYPENLAFVGKCLDLYPNMYIDTAERFRELGRQPYSARKFFVKYQDRILFGSDAYTEGMDWRYPWNFRFFETFDENFGGRWKLYGIGLDDEILEKLYYKNAEKVLKLDPCP